jgi:hypothetical protein
VPELDQPRPPREVITADDPDAALCTLDGSEHDYRVHAYRPSPKAPERQSWRCVWCHVVACGDVSEHDPCMQPYHHEPLPHLTPTGRSWPIGGNRAP